MKSIDSRKEQESLASRATREQSDSRIGRKRSARVRHPADVVFHPELLRDAHADQPREA